MRKIRIVSDSSSDILKLQSTEFSSAPMKIITDSREFTDDAQLDVSGMVDFFDGYKGKSHTSCPNVGDWLEAFGDADEVFCVTITSALSGSYNSACAAKQMYEGENAGKRVFVIDSLSAGPELTLIIGRLEAYVAEGLSFEEISDRITEYQKNTGLVFMLKSLKNFASNGRVSPIVAKIVGITGICIVGRASTEGTLEPVHKCRGEGRSLETLIEDLRNAGLHHGRVSIGHCRNEAAAKKLSEMIRAAFDRARVEIHPLRGLCSFYAEKGGLLVGFEKN
ncbi:MAG: DegV family EDD domain-containing protein [Ruminococcaceae bacterium]|nr:DegV family EDD domain-containing protein [Oscillospiraceae bacterium]